MKVQNNKAWLMVLPMLLLVAVSAIIPLMTVVNYSVQDTFGNNEFFWVGTEWFQEVLASELMALPLLIPWNVVGTIWQVFGRVDIGLLGHGLASLGIDYNYTQNTLDAWVTLIIMDVWHWTSLVVLLCYSGLVSIPEVYYQAARIDGASRWAVFRFIQLPKIKRVLLIAVLLRFMDSFMIYTEPFVVTGGGPGNSTTFLSIDLVQMAVGQFDLGPAAAMSLIYFLIILLLSWVFYTVMTSLDNDAASEQGRH